MISGGTGCLKYLTLVPLSVQTSNFTQKSFSETCDLVHFMEKRNISVQDMRLSTFQVTRPCQVVVLGFLTSEQGQRKRPASESLLLTTNLLWMARVHVFRSLSRQLSIKWMFRFAVDILALFKDELAGISNADTRIRMRTYAPSREHYWSVTQQQTGIWVLCSVLMGCVQNPEGLRFLCIVNVRLNFLPTTKHGFVLDREGKVMRLARGYIAFILLNPKSQLNLETDF